MSKSRIMEIIEAYGDTFEDSQDMSAADAKAIISGCRSKMEIVEYSYLYGHMVGSRENGKDRRVPIYNLREMTDDEWNRMAYQSRLEREVVS